MTGRRDKADKTRRALNAGAMREERGRGRIVLAMSAFVIAYAVIAGRLVTLGLAEERPNVAYQTAQEAVAAARPDIVDRNGEILATDLSTASLYAEPRRLLDVDEAIESLGTVMPELATATTRRRLASDAGFVWLKREITEEQRDRIHVLGVPGIDFLTENRRFYPGGALAGHVLGLVDVDNVGIAGLEKYIDDNGLAALHQAGLARTGEDLAPVRLSLDIRVQHAVRDELMRSLERYQAIAGIGVILDVHTGEVLAMSSLPDYDPNQPGQALDKDRMNRATGGVFELGSVFKTFTTAMALDSGKVKMTDSFDARRPIRVGGYTINDFHGTNRVLTVPEIFVHSSNIGTAHMALSVGVDAQKEFLKRVGLLEPIKTELPEVASPILPPRWSDLAAMTISFGHGVSVSPMNAVVATAALMNGGNLIQPTFFPRTRSEALATAKSVISPRTSMEMRELFLKNGKEGSGRKAQVEGYRVGGKTGTAEKVVNGRYVGSKRLNSFLASFPMDDPQYVVLVVIDEPQPEEGKYYATAGWNAAPTVANIVRRVAPMLGVQPKFEDPDAETLVVSYDNR
ncbi:peptidoglycan D,D-transpeptidase FtsI family protein [Amorphus coralli]|uniref:peptidoglycan D,D-transpeptidase FtsI family protein n=1 Tax=Amorphus coralli TaxID=340680 RepID=UPI000363EC28|nr:penicillin-binding protein 2 [Amorphus coralli]